MNRPRVQEVERSGSGQPALTIPNANRLPTTPAPARITMRIAFVLNRRVSSTRRLEDASGSAGRTESTSIRVRAVAGRFLSGPGCGPRLGGKRDAPVAGTPQSRSASPTGSRAPAPIQTADPVRCAARPGARLRLPKLDAAQGRG